jgi:nucleoside-diphosphate-sugar epimerase
MAMFIFARAILAGQPIKLFNHGRMRRDFTFVDDLYGATNRIALYRIPEPTPPMVDSATATASRSQDTAESVAAPGAAMLGFMGVTMRSPAFPDAVVAPRGRAFHSPCRKWS